MRSLQSKVTVDHSNQNGTVKLEFDVSELTPDEAQQMVDLHSKLLYEFDIKPDPLQKALDAVDNDENIYEHRLIGRSVAKDIIRTLAEELA